MKSILHTILKELRFMESNLNIVEHLLQKEDYRINWFVSSLQYRDSVIQLLEH